MLAAQRAAMAVIGICLLTASLLGATAALADGGSVSCPRGQMLLVQTRTCVLIVSRHRSEPQGQSRTTATNRSGGGSSAKVCVSPYSGKRIPCQGEMGTWYAKQGCYLTRTVPQPPKSDPLWRGHKTGAIFDCYAPIHGTTTIKLWLGTVPGRAASRPDPRDLAERAVALMRLRAVDIGIVPEDRPGRVGLVGLPVWMWAEDPEGASWGPLVRSVSAGGFSVRARARVDRVVWSMGDGRTVTCRKPGTPYADRFGMSASPDCGYRYEEQGVYTVRATAYWTVTWSGVGESGTIPLQFTRSTSITVGEVQVLVTQR